MKKGILILAMLGMLVFALTPVIAQVSQDNEQDADSGELNQASEVVGSGDNSNQCAGVQQVGNTGNAQTSTSVLQYGSDAGDFEFDEVGSSIDVSPSNGVECSQSVNQLAVAEGK